MTASAKEAPLLKTREIPGAGGVRARLRMNFSRDPASGETLLQESYQEPPLKVVRAFPGQDGSALVHLHNISGGLLGGDELTLQVHLAPETKVQLTTTSATRIYRFREEHAPATQETEIAVGEGALLEYLPDATIPYAGARYVQRTSIQLSQGAGLFWWEILAPGREARAEVFAYEHFEVRTRIAARGRMIAAENLCLRPALQDVSSLARLGAYRYAATFYICKVGIELNAWRATEDFVRDVTSSLTRPGEILWGVSSLTAHGLVVRCLTRHGREVLPGLHAVWRSAKRYLYGQEAIPPRKVN